MGIYAVAASDGRAIYARKPDRAMVPASTLKLVVGSAALDDLGTAFSFATTLATDGSTLYLRGSGDPLLEPADFNDAARTLAALGETRFDRLAGDASSVTSSRYPAGWQVDDLPYDYAAPPSALSIGENVLHVTVGAGAVGAAPAISVEPLQSVVTVRNAAVTGAADSTDTVDVRYAWEAPATLVVTGTIPAGAAADVLDVSALDPAALTVSLADGTLAQDGVVFTKPPTMAITPPDARVVWTHRSPALPALLRAMWLPSDNLLAESLLDALGMAAGSGTDTRARGLDRERAWLRSIGVDPTTATLADGSGMSAYDRITPRDLVTILLHDWNGPNRAIVLGALPVAGQSGTLEQDFTGTPLAGTLVAKTGTVTHARTLAGYLRTPHGTIVFALMVGGWMDDSPHASEHLRAFQESVLEALAKG